MARPWAARGQAASLLLLLLSWLGATAALRLPMHPKELLTLVPSKPPRLGSPTDILPAYIGALVPGQVLNWTGTCFAETLGYVNISDAVEGSGLGGMVLNLEVGCCSCAAGKG